MSEGGDPQYPSDGGAYWPPPVQHAPPSPYGQPGYGQPGHGQPGYGQPGHGLPAYGAHPPVPPPPPVPPRRSRRTLWISVGAAAVVVAVGVALLAVQLRDHDKVLDAKGTGGRTLILPSSVDGRKRITSIDTESVKAQLGQTLAKYGGNSNDVVAHAVVAYYGTLPTPSLTFVGIALRDVPALRDQTRRVGVEASLKEFMSGVAKSGASSGTGRAFDPGPKGGFMRCTDASVRSTPLAACGWGDESIFALTLLRGRPTLDAAAATTRTLRTAGEK